MKNNIKLIIRVYKSDFINIYSFENESYMQSWLKDNNVDVLYSKKIDFDVYYMIIKSSLERE